MRSDVIIVGSGLIGSVMALALAREGMSVQLVDRMPFDIAYKEQTDGRTIAIAHGSKVIFENLGLWDSLSEKAEPILDIRVVDGDSHSFVHYDHAKTGGEAAGEPFGYIVEHEWLKHCFISAVVAEQAIEKYAPANVESITCDAFGAHVTLADGMVLDASLLLAADGRFSAIRDMMGIAHKDMAYEQTAMVVAIKHSEQHHGVALERFLPAGPFAVLPLQGGLRSGVVWTENNASAEHMLALDDDAFTAEIQQRCDTYLGHVAIDGKRFSYPLKLTVTERTIAERAALIGDSAHAIHPIAGQGVNLGYRDVAVLADILARHRRLGLDIGTQDVLKEYARVRRADVMSMTAATDGINRLFSNDLLIPTVARRIGLRAVEKATPLKQYFMRRAMGMTGNLPPLMQRNVG